MAGNISTQILQEKEFLEKVLSEKSQKNSFLDKEIEKIINFSKNNSQKPNQNYKTNNWKNQLWN